MKQLFLTAALLLALTISVAQNKVLETEKRNQIKSAEKLVGEQLLVAFRQKSYKGISQYLAQVDDYNWITTTVKNNKQKILQEIEKAKKEQNKILQELQMKEYGPGKFYQQVIDKKITNKKFIEISTHWAKARNKIGNLKRLLKTFSKPIPTEELKKYIKAQRKRLQKSFDKVLNSKIDWKQTKLIKIKKSVIMRSISEVLPEMERADFKVIFSYNNKEYTLILDDCAKVARGWLFSDNIVWHPVHREEMLDKNAE